MSLIKKIRSVKIANFQSHKSTLIDFATQGLTVITGPSDSGKSAVIRALRWAFYNVPQGSDFITVGEDKCVVSMILEGGTIVERIRTRGGINRYTVNGEVFEGFGTGVPLEVQEATGIRKLQIGDINFMLNLSEQLDGPFLGKSVPGSARAKVLGKLAGTEEIDFAGKEVGTDLYRARREQEGLQKNIEAIQEDLSQYDWIPSRETQLAALQVIIDRTKKAQTEAVALRALSDQYENLSTFVMNLRSNILRLTHAEEGIDRIKNTEEKIELQKVLHSFNALYSQSSAQKLAFNSTIKRLHGIDQAGDMLKIAKDRHSQRGELNVLRIQHDQLFVRIQEIFSWIGLHVECISGLTLTLDKVIEALEKEVLLKQVLDDYQAVNSTLDILDKKSARLDNVDTALNHLAVAVARLEESIQGKRLNTDYEFLLMATIPDLQDKVDCRTVDIEKLENDYLSLLQSVGKCPTCGSEINIEKLREVI